MYRSKVFIKQSYFQQLILEVFEESTGPGIFSLHRFLAVFGLELYTKNSGHRYIK
jgi:hypothetical protein